MGKYLKAAFWNRWNILALLGGFGVALLSGRMDIVLPLVAAGEIAYLGFLSTNNTFRSYVDVQNAGADRKRRSKSEKETLRRILRELPSEAIDRFEQLRERCQDLRQIAANLQGPEARAPGSLDTLQVEGLDRLLWIFLRLLFTHHALTQFLDKTQVDTIHNDIERLENRLAQVDPDDASEHAAKVRRAIEDNLATSRGRLANYEKAQANHEFVELEIDRLSNKIKSLSELAVNRREHDFISNQVDEVAGSMKQTERTMNELDFATGLGEMNVTAPQLLQQGTRGY